MPAPLRRGSNRTRRRGVTRGARAGPRARASRVARVASQAAAGVARDCPRRRTVRSNGSTPRRRRTASIDACSTRRSRPNGWSERSQAADSSRRVVVNGPCDARQATCGRKSSSPEASGSTERDKSRSPGLLLVAGSALIAHVVMANAHVVDGGRILQRPAGGVARSELQWVRRTYPQIWQRAVPVSGSTSRKLVQPFVAQYRRVELLARRRRRRMEDARPVTDEVVDRDIMCLWSVLSGAPSSRDRRSAARPMCGPGAPAHGTRFLWTSARRTGSVILALEPGRRVGRVTHRVSGRTAEPSNARQTARQRLMP